MASGSPILAVDTIEDSIQAFRRGDFIVVLDEPTRENEGDLIIAADSITPSKMAFMVRYTSGLICTPIPSHLANKLLLPPMVPPSESTDPHGTAYTISIDSSAPSVTTGISAQDRSLTCLTLTAKDVTPASFRRPGHVFPLRARDGGVLERTGHTEAGVDFCRLAGRGEAAIISELVDDGEPIEGITNGLGKSTSKVPEFRGAGMLRGQGCVDFARRWGLKVCTIEDLVAYRLAKGV